MALTLGMIGAPTIPDTGADFMDLEAYVPMEEKKYDVTNLIESACTCFWFPCCGWTSKTMLLGDQEVTLIERNWCGSSRQRRPYAQLGSVEKHTNCGCCYAIASDLTPLNDKGEGGLSPGCGCDEPLVMEIVAELQGRKEKRGSIAQIKKLEFMLKKLEKLAVQMPLLLDHLKASYKVKHPPMAEQPKTFDTVTFDVSNYLELACGCTARELSLEAEEAVLRTNGCLGLSSAVQKREYAQLETVEMHKACICCRSANSGLGSLQPGCLGNRTVLTRIVAELQERQSQRGNIAQIRMQEKMLPYFEDLDQEFLTALERLGVQFPPDQATMAALWGSGDASSPLPDWQLLKSQGVSSVVTSEKVGSRTIDITNHVESFCNCLCTLGLAGFTTRSIELEADECYITEKNKLDDSRIKLPYAQLGSVDHDVGCCCCYSVNDISPGWGCFNAEQVEDLAAELQQRKVKRGNIAQVKQLEAMQSTSVDLEGRSRLMNHKQGIMYPPSQETIERIYGQAVPKGLLQTPAETPHIQPAEKFPIVQWDVTNYWESCCLLMVSCCTRGWNKRKLELEEEEMYIVQTSWCGRSNERVPYAQLGSVEVETTCCCCIQIPEIALPGCGCQKELVEEIAEELQQRKVKRGNIAQLKMQENIVNELLRLGVQVDLLLDEQGVVYPPSQETMGRLFP